MSRPVPKFTARRLRKIRARLAPIAALLVLLPSLCLCCIPSVDAAVNAAADAAGNHRTGHECCPPKADRGAPQGPAGENTAAQNTAIENAATQYAGALKTKNAGTQDSGSRGTAPEAAGCCLQDSAIEAVLATPLDLDFQIAACSFATTTFATSRSQNAKAAEITATTPRSTGPPIYLKVESFLI